MGFEYALVHLKYTIPPAIGLTLLSRPLITRTDIYKICFLIIIAVVSTIPWDSYLIKCKIWSYPPSVIIGPALLSIPAEELFFFVIQTYNTSLIYMLLNKPVFGPGHLRVESSTRDIAFQHIVGILLSGVVGVGAFYIWEWEERAYLGLILAWATPFALLLWTLSSQFLIRLPLTSTIIPIAIPTVYLWVVDTLALRKGTWTIETGTKLGVHLWDGLEVEEALFFLATNTLIVLGLVAFDHALAIAWSFPALFPEVSDLPSPLLLIQALLVWPSRYDADRLAGIKQAVGRLQKKSRSFYLASSTFSGRLRIDLMLLYSFCRVADDLVDDALSETEAREYIDKLSNYLRLIYAHTENFTILTTEDLERDIGSFPKSSRAALQLLPTHILSSEPLYELLEGFKTDLQFATDSKSFPIRTESDLEIYAARVAGTVAELCLELVFEHTRSHTTPSERERLIRAGGRMGIALQYVNIARDIATDAAIGRVYLPTDWLKEEDLTPQYVLGHPAGSRIEKVRERLLNKAFEVYLEAEPAISQIPADARPSMRVAVESYMEIGRVLREKGYVVKRGKATVSKLRRLRVAYQALIKG